MDQMLNKWDVLDFSQWEPHSKQEEIVSDTTRHRLVCAGRRFGKSDVGGHELLPEAMFTRGMAEWLKENDKRREFWIVGPEYSDSEKEFRVLWNNLRRLEVPFDKPGSYNNTETGLMQVSLWGGTFIVHAKSAKFPSTLVGEGLSGVILAEAAKLKESVWTKYLRPPLADFNGWSLHSSTPEGKNWFYDNYKRGQDPKSRDWKSWRCPSWLNPYVYKQKTSSRHVRLLQEILERNRHSKEARDIFELAAQLNLQIDPEILSFMDDLTPEAFEQEVAAGFSDFVGKVFKRFDEDIHVGDFKYNPKWETYACVDYGFTNPNVWLLLQIGPWSEIRVIGEVYERGLTIPDFAAAIKARGLAPQNVLRFYPDPASPGDTAQLEDLLKIPSATNTGGELKPRLDAIRDALLPRPKHLPDDHPEKKPQLQIDRSCVMTIHDMSEYRYPKRKGESAENNSEENPMKKDDHAPEALGRFFKGHFNTPDVEASHASVRKVNMGR